MISTRALSIPPWCHRKRQPPNDTVAPKPTEGRQTEGAPTEARQIEVDHRVDSNEIGKVVVTVIVPVVGVVRHRVDKTTIGGGIEGKVTIYGQRGSLSGAWRESG